MNRLDKDMLSLIAMELDLPSVLKLCETNKKINLSICENEHFWNQRLKKNFNVTVEKNAKSIYIIFYNLYYLKKKLKLPYSLNELYELKELYLQNKNITEIPNELFILKNLETLDLSGNKIREIPKGISKLKNLENLYLDGNDISELPKEMENLKKLRKLTLERNRKLEKIPMGIGKLPLILLMIGKTKIKEVPRGFKHMKNNVLF